MTTVVGGVLAILFVDPPWRWLIIGALLLTDVIEIAIWLRWRNKKSITGIESLVGQGGRAASTLDPDGQVRVRGQLWSAHSTERVEVGDDVTVTAVDGLKLEVAPAVAARPDV
ncbi:MAG TPA: NfeD family protein [Actinomycetota bacterium]|nr:NfeD family protein [Actinomycetota bacterium]